MRLRLVNSFCKCPNSKTTYDGVFNFMLLGKMALATQA